MYCRITRLWAPEVLLDPKHGVARAITRTHTADVESKTIVFQGGEPFTYSGGRGYLLPDWSLETGCPHFIDRFPRRGYYDARVDRPSLCPRDEDIGEENPHQSNE